MYVPLLHDGSLLGPSASAELLIISSSSNLIKSHLGIRYADDRCSSTEFVRIYVVRFLKNILGKINSYKTVVEFPTPLSIYSYTVVY